MYGLVVAATLLTTSATPAWGCHGCNGGCYGCWGHSCHGAFGCYGSGSCHGCWSCWGGCTGYWGGCSGCWGSCTGCGGGGMWGNWYAASSSGSCTGGWGSCTGCYGCYGGWPVAAVYPPAQAAVVNAAPTAPAPVATQPDAEIKASPDRATLIVHVPADADLYVDGVRADLTSSRRVIVSPPLKAGSDYFYTLKTKAIHNGHATTQSRRVTVRAGALTRVDFTDPSQPAPAELDVRLPADTRLYVNNVLIPKAAARKSFETPPLDPGKKYHYVLRAERNRGDRSTSETRQVTVQAGQRVEVRFDEARSVKTAQR